MIAIIPMKEHSERVPGKNIRDLGGKPLFCWIIRSLLESKKVNYVVVNTDSLLIGGLVRRYFPSVEILYRPDYLLGDMITGNDLIRWTINQLCGEHFIYTHSTNPFLENTTIDRAIEAYFSQLDKHDSLMGVTRHQMRLYHQDGKPLNHNPRDLGRSQDLKPLYEDNSNIYIFSRNSFYNGGRVGRRPQLFEIPKYEAIDIDTEDDWIMAEAMAHVKVAGNRTRVSGTENSRI